MSALRGEPAGTDGGRTGSGGARGERTGARGALVTVYSAPGCHLCVDALGDLRALRAELEFELCERDITRDEALHRAYFERIPVVTLDGEELCEYVVDEQILRERLESRR